MKLIRLVGTVFLSSLVAGHSAMLPDDWELAGFVEAELRVFPEQPLDPDQFEHFDASIALEPELFKRWDEPDVSLTLRPFVRLDLQDSERTHVDLREFMIHKASDRWELRAGVGRVFWGVTESQHLVDVINQTDLVENIDGEEKLGQPMVNFTWVTDRVGSWDFFYLPYFRERTFPGPDGRLRSHPVVDADSPIYQSSWEEWHPDLSARWSQALGDFDLGAYYFYGTSRDPLFQPEVGGDGNVRLRPVYNLMHQVGLDGQWTREGWLLKFEGIAREGRSQHFQATVGGVEYTFYGLRESAIDLGVIGEYHYSTQRDPSQSLLNNDLFVGGRLTYNDTRDTSLLGGVFWDHQDDTTSARVEFERRLGDRYTLEIQAQWFANVPANDVAYAFRRDSFIQVGLRRYF